MLRQRRMGGDQEEMGGYYIGEVDEVIIHMNIYIRTYLQTRSHKYLLQKRTIR